MNDRQTKQYDAGITGFQTLTNHATDFVPDIPLNGKKTELQNEIQKIELDNSKQLRNKGFAAHKLTDVTSMGDHAWTIRNLMVEFAKAQNDDILLHKIDFTKSELTHGAVLSRKQNAQKVYDNANAQIAAMTAAGYNITPAQVGQLLLDINAVTLDEGTPDANKADTVAATLALAQDFPDLKKIEESIFNLMVPYASTNIDFYNAVMDGFEILDILPRHIASRIVVSDTIANVRLANADVKIVELNLVKKSSKRGIVDFSHQNVPEGNYNIQITLNGYVLFTLNNVAIYNDRMIRIEAKMTKV